jgi:Asp-tRNA(Asn)/Glu-tRNA(Gln) amidotransferase A subunit family amidase
MKNKFIAGFIALCIFLLGAFSGPWLADRLTPDDIRAAARVMDVEFTQAEIDSLLPDVEDNRRAFASLRQMPFDNAVSPVLTFNPMPMGYVPPTGQRPVVFSKPGQVRLPADMEDLAWYSVRQLAELLRTRKISSETLTRFFIERLKKYDTRLQCVITLTEDLAIAQARRADAEIKAGNYKGLLHGIPYGAKDLLAKKGYKTTWGAMPYKDQVLDYDATVVQKLENAGAVLVAKLTLGALAWGDVWYGGTTKNPWNADTGSSGSSAGSAAAVSAGLLPFAIGTETLGSIVSPATTCGVTGLRPTFGRVSRHGAMALSWSMDKIGPICRTVEDCAIVFQAIYGPDGKDRAVVDVPFNFNSDENPAKLRIGYLKQDFERPYPFRKQDSLSLARLRGLGFELIPVELPPLPDIRFILEAEAAAAFDDLTRSGKDDLMVRQIRNAWPNVFRSARFIPAVEYIQANRRRAELIEAVHREVFSKVEVYVHPSWGGSSLTITNFTGHPCVVIPNGFQANGRPTSISFTAGLYEEGMALAVARALQNATAHHLERPKLQVQ